MPQLYSAFSSRTARIRRTAASPRLTTAIRRGNFTPASNMRSVYVSRRSPTIGSAPRSTRTAAACSTATSRISLGRTGAESGFHFAEQLEAVLLHHSPQHVGKLTKQPGGRFSVEMGVATGFDRRPGRRQSPALPSRLSSRGMHLVARGGRRRVHGHHVWSARTRFGMVGWTSCRAAPI
jgi:hypothetical protein